MPDRPPDARPPLTLRAFMRRQIGCCLDCRVCRNETIAAKAVARYLIGRLRAESATMYGDHATSDLTLLADELEHELGAR